MDRYPADWYDEPEDYGPACRACRRGQPGCTCPEPRRREPPIQKEKKHA
jgi:hypothetical protein